ncbi:MAG: extracellular solute-binding protein [Treponema sp.]|jgi:raffinose/stachyose/melibiose transport system substrate-binding protein|nr:extracellular solute-binding protein [Treponema sp.]
MKKTKRVCFVTAVLAAALTAACGGKTEGGSGGTRAIELTIWNLSGRQVPLDAAAGEFAAANPGIRITPAYYDTDGIKDATKVAASSGTLPGLWFNWGGMLGGFYAENDLIYDLKDYAAVNGWDKIFNGGALSLCTLDGKLAGYPTSFNVMGIYYRKDTFARYGLEVPKTFEEFEQVCATLKRNGITPITTAGLYGWHVMRFVEVLIEHYTGAELHDQMNTFQASYNHPAIVQAFTKFKEFADKGYFPAGFLTLDPNDTGLEIFAGTAAMDVQGQWMDGSIIQEEQDVSNFGTFAFPSGGTNRMSAFAEMIQFNKNLSQEQIEASVKFLDFFQGKEHVGKYSEYYNLPLPRLDADMPDGQPNVPVMLSTANKNGTFTVTDQAFPTEVADVLFHVQDGLVTGQTTPQEGAAAIQTAIEAYLKK